MKKRTIGIIGGMGPQASVYLYDLLIEKSIKLYGAINNDDFPDIVLFSIPVPDFISDTSKKNTALSMIGQKVEKARTFNISGLAIACNTAHILLEDLKKETSIPFVSMIDETVKEIKEKKIRTVGLLGSPILMKSNLYQERLVKEKIRTITLNKTQLDQIEGITRNIIKGKKTRKDVKSLIKIALSLKESGAQGILLGCTELPIIFPKRIDIPVFNSLEILAESLLNGYFGSKN